MVSTTSKYMLGQVGGFPLRLSWLPRLVDRYKKKQHIPRDPEKIACELGIGKNMAKSLRIWALTAGVIDDHGIFLPLARKLFSRSDPFLEKGESVALLHWLISSNLERFTANAWLFNFFRTSTFTTASATQHFSNYLAGRGEKYADGTIRTDVETAIRMYAGSYDKKYDEIDDRFFYPLRLLTRRRGEGRTLFARSWEHSRPHVTPAVLTYALLQTLAKRGTNSSLLTDLHISSDDCAAPGAVFGFTRDGFFAAAENMVSADAKSFSLASMPGGDFSLRVSGSLGKRCAQGSATVAEEAYFQLV